MDRLSSIANFSKDPSRCLDIYYNNNSAENNKYSKKFFDLLIECWRRWDMYFSSQHKKINKKADKIRKKFKQEEMHYHLFNEELANTK